MKKFDFLKELRVGDFVTVYEDPGYRHFNKVTKISRNYIYTDFFGYKFSLATGECANMYNRSLYRLARQTELDKKKSIEKYRVKDIKNIIFSDMSDSKKIKNIIEYVNGL